MAYASSGNAKMTESGRVKYARPISPATAKMRLPLPVAGPRSVTHTAASSKNVSSPVSIPVSAQNESG